ncbi:hypothetical protein ABZ864_22675 [Streptomyces sp. NPDC047082]|uniref:hypothetical protein n=1 Tax=Streptomyces sp. NPDC047082 TaxID=3155259 RepID=UPI0033CA04A3
MGSLRLTLCTGLLVATALVPTAHAAEGGVSVTPSTPAPGGIVALRVSGCGGTTGTAASSAFVSDARLVGVAGALAGETQVRSAAEPGSYDVKVTCADSVVNGKVTVAGTSSQDASQPDPLSSGAASPAAPVDAGGGGTAHFASVDAHADGPGTAHAVVGLVLAGLAAVAVGLRSARRSRETD